MKNLILLTMVLFFGIGINIQAGEPDFKKIFNGKDFTGWQVPDNNIWWTIHDGILKTKSDPEKTASILWTAKEYTDFIIQVDFKFGEGTVDSGVFLRDINEQIQMGISGKYKRDMTCSPYIGSLGDYPVEAKGIKELLKNDDWNTMRIKADGNKYTVWLNGRKVMKYTSDTAIEKGPIGLQLHGNKVMDIEFRNILCAEIN
jgi:hypothetical protein